jgi:hypothetical protein
MRGDDFGVGGFLEDMPVLVLVLAGVVTLAGTGVWAEELKADARAEAELRSLANNLLDRVQWALSDGSGSCISVNRIAMVNLSGAATTMPPRTSWLSSVEIVHPWCELVLLVKSGDEGSATRAASASRLLDAPCDPDWRVLLKVTVIVWTSG